MPNPTQNPREAFLTGRKAARDGVTLYDGERFPINFDRETQDRVEKLATAWRVPRAEMVRYLVSAALDTVEQIPVPPLPNPQEDQNRKEPTT